MEMKNLPPGDQSRARNDYRHRDQSDKEQEYITVKSSLICLDFLSYRLGHSIQSDALFGTSQGEITTFCSGRHFVLNENAHQAAINCIKVSDRLATSHSVTVMTGGEDGLLKIWDSSKNSWSPDALVFLTYFSVLPNFFIFKFSF